MSCAASDSGIVLVGSKAPRKTWLTSTLTSMFPLRTKSFRSSPVGFFGIATESPLAWRMAAACPRSDPITARASSRDIAGSVKTTSMSTERRGMSCTKRFRAVPPLIAKRGEASTAGAMSISSRTVSMYSCFMP